MRSLKSRRTPRNHVNLAYGLKTITARLVSLLDTPKVAGELTVAETDVTPEASGVKVAVAPAEPGLIVIGLTIVPIDCAELLMLTVTAGLPGASDCTCAKVLLRLSWAVKTVY